MDATKHAPYALAPTKALYRAEGALSARMGNTRSPGNEYSMPVFGTGTSWQSRAFAAGFREECARLQRRVVPD
jgi:hypothetical protein